MGSVQGLCHCLSRKGENTVVQAERKLPQAMNETITRVCPICGRAVESNPHRRTSHQRWIVIQRLDSYGDARIYIRYNHYYEGGDSRTRADVWRQYGMEMPVAGIVRKQGSSGRIQNLVLSHLATHPDWIRRAHLQRMSQSSEKNITKAMRSLEQKQLVKVKRNERGELYYAIREGAV